MTERMLFGVTSPNTALAFLDGHLRELVDAGAEVRLVCGEDRSNRMTIFGATNRVSVAEVALSRQPRPSQDLLTFFKILRIVQSYRPTIVSVGTPKMSLLLLLGAWMTGVPRRVYICHGLRHEGLSGWKRRLASALERVLCATATDVAAVSPSVKQGLTEIGVKRTRIRVLGSGSPDGVDPEFFNSVAPSDLSAFRADSRITERHATAAFVARLTRDKGIRTLLTTAESLPEVQFLVVGDAEPTDAADASVISCLRELPNVRVLGRREDVRVIYAASDLLLLPSRREGLPTVVLEASATGIPTVAMDATGVRDVVIDMHTGRLIKQGADMEFVAAVASLVGDRELRYRLGSQARDFVSNRFCQSTVRSQWREFYLGSSTGE